MEYNEFAERLRQCVEEALPGYGIELREVLKNNGVKLMGLVMNEPGHKASPTIYLERFYDLYLDGTGLDEITDRIVEIGRESTLTDDFDMEFFSDYKHVKKNLFLKAVNREQNSELLSDVPYLPFLDLALIPYVLIRQREIGNASTIVHENMLSYWKVDDKRLLSDAMRNMERSYGYELTPMRELLCDLMQGEEEEIPEEEPNMYVLLSPGMHYCAALMAVESIMKAVSDRIGSDLVVLPSSIHEVIIVPTNEQGNEERLNELVRSVNETCVSSEEILSDHAYFYKRGLGYVTA
ncbi:MAG: hypothetical protein J5518_06685 [Lachnospiraceae bacterium]|nr:hypothetical protein [Lachnospiraceae bacterium]